MWKFNTSVACTLPQIVLEGGFHANFRKVQRIPPPEQQLPAPLRKKEICPCRRTQEQAWENLQTPRTGLRLSALLVHTRGRCIFWSVPVGLLSLCNQVLLLPHVCPSR